MLNNKGLKLTGISVVMCTYNGNLYIEEQLNSIVNQSYPLNEILIFDDASTDGTWETLQQFQLANPLISLQRNNTTLGYNQNFQQALLTASNEVIAIADQDDIWEHNKIELLLEAWTEDTPMIYCNSVRFRDSDPSQVIPLKKYLRFNGEDGRRLFFNNTVSGHAVLIKKEFLKSAVPFHTDIFYDWWMAVVASYNGGVSFLNKTLVYQRVHGRNVSVIKPVPYQEEFVNHRNMVITHLKHFVTCKQMPEAHVKFTNRLITFFNKRSESKLVKLKLMLFIFNNRKILFSTNAGKSDFSYAKYAYRWAFFTSIFIIILADWLVWRITVLLST